MDNKGVGVKDPGRLMLITDSTLFPDKKAFLRASEGALRGGVDTIQLREKALSARDLLGLAHKLRELTIRFNAKLLINERVDIAMLAGADGVHLPVKAFSPSQARALMGDKAIIGISTHSAAGALQAEAGGADYVTLGPVYHTASKAPYGEPIGQKPLTEAAAHLKIPLYALGGINKERVGEVLEAGASGVALISAILAGKDTESRAREITDELIKYNETCRRAL